MREHQKQGGKQSDVEGESADGDQTAVAQQQAEATRRFLMTKAQGAASAVVMGANIFQIAVRGMDEKKLHEKIDANSAESIKDGVVDRVWDSFKEKIAEVGEIGSTVVENSAAVFLTVKSMVGEHIQAKKELSILEVADSIVAAMADKSILLETALRNAIRSLPSKSLLGLRKALRKAHAAADEGDSPENGYIADGIEDSLLVKIGMPRGDSVASEQYAIAAFGAFQMGVISTMPAHEAGEAIQDRLAHPDGDKEAVEEAESGKMGKEYNKKLNRDKSVRARTEAT